MSGKKWESYEEVAAYLLNQCAEHFGVGHFEGKQVIPGDSGTKWEIDAKGCAVDGNSFLVVECKRHTKTGISQAITGALAWTIQDSAASGGILVSPVGLQEGAKKVAAAAKIIEVRLDEKSTRTDYMMRFLDQIRIGFSDHANLQITDSLRITVKDKDGNIREDRCY